MSLHIRTEPVRTYREFGISNPAGGSAGAAVTVAVSLETAFPSIPPPLPPDYFVEVEVSQPAVASVTSKTAQGFNVTLTPVPSTATLAAGTFNVWVSC